MYEFLCGAPPFEAPTTDEVILFVPSPSYRSWAYSCCLSIACTQTLLRIAGKKDGDIKFPAHVSLEAKDLIRKARNAVSGKMAWCVFENLVVPPPFSS